MGTSGEPLSFIVSRLTFRTFGHYRYFTLVIYSLTRMMLAQTSIHCGVGSLGQRAIASFQHARKTVRCGPDIGPAREHPKDVD
jgi:hypothetical protein